MASTSTLPLLSLGTLILSKSGLGEVPAVQTKVRVGISSTIVEQNPAAVEFRQSRLQASLDAARTELFKSVCRQGRSHFRQDSIAGMDQHHPNVGLLDSRVVPSSAANKVVHFRQCLHAGKSTTSHDERKDFTPRLLLGFEFSMFQFVNEVGVQGRGVGQAFHRQCMLLNARQIKKAGHRA